jgi:hypothetical protein
VRALLRSPQATVRLEADPGDARTVIARDMLSVAEVALHTALLSGNAAMVRWLAAPDGSSLAKPCLTWDDTPPIVLGDDACAALLGGRVCGGAAPRLVPPGAGSFELLPAFVEAWPRYGWGLALLLELLFGPDCDEVFYASLPTVEDGLLSE